MPSLPITAPLRLRWIVITLLALIGVLALKGNTQAQVQRISGFQPTTIAIVDGDLITSPHSESAVGNVIIRDGVLDDVGPDAVVPRDAFVIDAKGLTVYAGFIDAAASDLLSSENTPKPLAGRRVDFGRYVLAATRPDNRRSLTPEFQAHDGLTSDPKIFESLRKLGYTTVHVLPSGRIASGQGAIVTTSGTPRREAALIRRTFSEFQLFRPQGSGYPVTLMGATAHLRQAFLDAEHYTSHWDGYRRNPSLVERPPIDLSLESISQVRSQQQRAVFLANRRDDIHRALNFATEHDIPITIWGGREAYRCIERLKQANASIVAQINYSEKPEIKPNPASEELKTDINSPLAFQKERLRIWEETASGLSRLHEAGIEFAISSHGHEKREDFFRNLRFAIEYGLPRDVAVAALTTNSAKLLGIEQRVGSLSAGKLAHVIVMTGPFDSEKSRVRYLVVDGQKFEYNRDAKPAEEDASDSLDLSGQWQLTMESAQGPTHATLALDHSDKRLKGTFKSASGNGRVTNASVSDDNIRFDVEIGAGAQSLKIQFTGEYSAESISGTLSSAFGAQTKWTAKRQQQPSSESTNPVTVSFEADDDSDKTDVDSRQSESHSGPDSWPVETERDRKRRQVRTGGNLLVRGGTILTGTGQTLTGNSILIKSGRIVAIAPDLATDDGVTVVDATDRFVIPGIIDTHSHIMISAGTNESSQSIVPEVRVKDVVNTADPSAYRALAGGTTTARLLHGSANVIGGQDAVVKLKYGLPAGQQILHDAPQGVKFALGENVKSRETRFPNTRMGVEATLNRAFLEAIDYRRKWMEYEKQTAEQDHPESLRPPRRDLRLEALADIVDHQKFIHSHCYRADEILMLLRVASHLGIRVWSLQHVLEGYKVAPEIVAHGASCSTFSDWWAYKVEAYDATPYNAALLKQAGANIVIKSDNSELIRHMNLEAAKTVRYGNMSPADALATVTLNSARELGLEDRIGSIEVGKEADLAIFSGHPLSPFSKCEQTIIDGEIYFTRSDQPTAMTAAAAKRSARPETLEFASQEIREKILDLSPSPDGRYAITGGTIHPVDGPVIANGTLLVEGSRIAAVGRDIAIPTGTKLIDAQGLHVFPGIIDAGTTLGLTEIGRVTETRDYSESGNLQPDLRAGVAINPDSELFPVARAGGITTTLVCPTGGMIAGQSSLVKLAGWTAPDMVLDYEAALRINWPTGSRAKSQREQLHNFLEQARYYEKLSSLPAEEGFEPPVADPRLDALKPYLLRERPVIIEADSYKEIAEALLFGEEEELKIIISGGTEAWKLADELKRREVPVIVGPVMRRPLAEYDPYDAPYANPGHLYDAGVDFCIRSDSATNSRNAPFEAAMAVAFGLPADEALKAITLGPAKILGIGEETGSLTPGKLADIVIADGSILQHTTQIKGTFIHGVPYPPESKHTRSYRRYQQRLEEHRSRQQIGEPAAQAEPDQVEIESQDIQ